MTDFAARDCAFSSRGSLSSPLAKIFRADTDVPGKIKKGDAAGRQSCQTPLLGDPSARFSRKRRGRNKIAAILSQAAHRGDHWSLGLRSTPKRAALRASQGFRASRETSDIIH